MKPACCLAESRKEFADPWRVAPIATEIPDLTEHY
jgi:hypothetical protein